MLRAQWGHLKGWSWEGPEGCEQAAALLLLLLWRELSPSPSQGCHGARAEPGSRGAGALFSCVSGARVSSSWGEIQGREVQCPLQSGALTLSGV